MKVKVCRNGPEGRGVYCIFPLRRKVSMIEDWWGEADRDGEYGGGLLPVEVCPKFFHRVSNVRLKLFGGPVIAEIPKGAIKLVKGV